MKPQGDSARENWGKENSPQRWMGIKTGRRRRRRGREKKKDLGKYWHIIFIFFAFLSSLHLRSFSCSMLVYISPGRSNKITEMGKQSKTRNPLRSNLGSCFPTPYSPWSSHCHTSDMSKWKKEREKLKFDWSFPLDKFLPYKEMRKLALTTIELLIFNVSLEPQQDFLTGLTSTWPLLEHKS